MKSLPSMVATALSLLLVATLFFSCRSGSKMEVVPSFSTIEEFTSAYVVFLQGSDSYDVRSFFITEADIAVFDSLGFGPSDDDRKEFEETFLPLASDSGRQQFTNTLRNDFDSWRQRFKVPDEALSFVKILEAPRSMTKDGITLSGFSDAHAVLETSSGQIFKLRLEEVRNCGNGWHLMQWDMI